jgi:hypothetical protein
MMSRITVVSSLVLSAVIALAQGPITDKVTVSFPNPVVVSGTTLPAGEYTIRQLPSSNNPRVLEFTSDNGTKVEVTTTAFPILDNRNQKPTSVILEQRGNAYHVSQIWLAGKNYGYGLVPGDANSATAATSQAIRLTATYTPAGQQAAAATEPTAVAQAQPPPPAPTTPAPEPQQQTQAQASPPAPAAQPEPTPAPAPSPTLTDTPAQETRRTTPDMPATASHWPLLMLAGSLLSAAGLRLRRG